MAMCHLVSRYTWDRNYSYDIPYRHPAAEVEAIISCFKDGYSPGHEAGDAFGGIPGISWLSYAQLVNLHEFNLAISFFGPYHDEGETDYMCTRK